MINVEDFIDGSGYASFIDVISIASIKPIIGCHRHSICTHA